MKFEKRENYILDTAESFGFVSISEAARHLDVSIETVRRDINKLCATGRLKKTRGGALPVKEQFRRDSEYKARMLNNREEKLSVGATAAAMIRDNSVVALDCGVSIQSVATHVSGVKDVTFVTNSLPISMILMHKMSDGDITGRVILIGGELDVENKFSKGAAAAELVEKFCFDIAFISCTAVSSMVSSYNMDECAFSSRLLRRAAHSVLVADSDKLGRTSLFSFARISDFDFLIVDSKRAVPSELDKVLKETGKTQLIIADGTKGSKVKFFNG